MWWSFMKEYIIKIRRGIPILWQLWRIIIDNTTKLPNLNEVDLFSIYIYQVHTREKMENHTSAGNDTKTIRPSDWLISSSSSSSFCSLLFFFCFSCFLLLFLISFFFRGKRTRDSCDRVIYHDRVIADDATSCMGIFTLILLREENQIVRDMWRL